MDGIEDKPGVLHHLARRCGGAGPDLVDALPTENLAFNVQPSMLVVVEQNASWSAFLFEHLDFCPEIIDPLSLRAIDPVGEDDQQQLLRPPDGHHGFDPCSGSEASQLVL